MDIHQTTLKAAGTGWNSFAKTLWITIQLHTLVLRAEPGPGLGNKIKKPACLAIRHFFFEKNSLKALNGHIYTKSTCVCRQHVLTIGQKGFEQDLRKTMTWNQENQGLFKTWLISSFLAFQSSSSWFSMFSTIDVFAGLILRYLRWGLCSLLAGARPSRVSRRRGMSLVWMLDHSLWLENNGVGCFWNKKIDRN